MPVVRYVEHNFSQFFVCFTYGMLVSSFTFLLSHIYQYFLRPFAMLRMAFPTPRLSIGNTVK